jgi:hypothetical protein
MIDAAMPHFSDPHFRSALKLGFQTNSEWRLSKNGFSVKR